MSRQLWNRRRTVSLTILKTKTLRQTVWRSKKNIWNRNKVQFKKKIMLQNATKFFFCYETFENVRKRIEVQFQEDKLKQSLDQNAIKIRKKLTRCKDIKALNLQSDNELQIAIFDSP